MENRHRTYQRQSMGLVFFLFVLVLLTLLGRLFLSHDRKSGLLWSTGEGTS